MSRELGKGTMFNVCIPVNFLQEPKKEPYLQQEIPIYQSKNDIHINILVVEDAAPIRRAMKLLLEHIGATVVFANDGTTALNLNINQYNMVFMDLGLGEMSGLEVTKFLRDRHGHKVPLLHSQLMLMITTRKNV